MEKEHPEDFMGFQPSMIKPDIRHFEITGKTSPDKPTESCLMHFRPDDDGPRGCEKAV